MSARRQVEAESVEPAEEVVDPHIILRRAGERFVHNRRENRMKAYAELQETLMSHMGALVPSVCSLKDFLSSNYDLEQFIKTDQGAQADPVVAIEEWLNVDRAA